MYYCNTGEIFHIMAQTLINMNVSSEDLNSIFNAMSELNEALKNHAKEI